MEYYLQRKKPSQGKVFHKQWALTAIILHRCFHRIWIMDFIAKQIGFSKGIGFYWILSNYFYHTKMSFTVNQLYSERYNSAVEFCRLYRRSLKYRAFNLFCNEMALRDTWKLSPASNTAERQKGEMLKIFLWE